MADNNYGFGQGQDPDKLEVESRYTFYLFIAIIIFALGYMVVSFLKPLILLIFPFMTYLLLTLLIKII